jgi:oxalate decarboxylase
VPSKHKFDLKKQGILRKCRGGYRLMLNAKKASFSHHMSLATIVLEKGGVREPHWHPNANELTYCAEGKALITLFSPHNTHDTFILSAGDVAHFPKGYIHHIENIHSGPSRFILAYDHSSPEDLDLSESTGSMSAHVLAATFGSTKTTFEKLKKHATDRFIFEKNLSAKPTLSSTANPNKLHLEQISPQIKTKGGSAKIANSSNLPSLQTLALFSLRIAKNGIREPHWHPNATELNFVLNGKARLTIFSPGGKIDTFTLGIGQGSLIPAGYFHHIENIGTDELHMTVYFNNRNPDDIGLSGALSAYSKEILASLFSVDPKFFAQIRQFQEDRMIVAGGG